MRAAVLLSGLVLCLAGNVRANSTSPGHAVVQIDGAEVRSRPGDKAVVLAKLPRGTPVTVWGQRPGGWLEIAPPKDSFSWINHKFVDPAPNRQGLTVVSKVPVPLRFGKAGMMHQPTDVETELRVNHGTTLVALSAKPVEAEGSHWWPVQSPDAERRYLRESAVQPITVASKERAGEPVRPATGFPAPGGGTADATTLWRQAQEADRQGKVAEAIRLYGELARVTTDENTRILALNRAQFLRDGPRRAATVPTSASPFQPAVQPRGTLPRATPQYPVGTAPPVGMSSQNQRPDGLVRSGPGLLVRTAIFIDGRKAYALMSSQGAHRMYVTADGVNLESHVERNVELIGRAVYHGQLRTNYMQATQVVPLQ
jgi:hypothetical protein